MGEKRVKAEQFIFTEKTFLQKLEIGDKAGVLGIKAIMLNGKPVMITNDIRDVTVVVNRLVDANDFPVRS
jgi:hypothetical protein